MYLAGSTTDPPRLRTVSVWITRQNYPPKASRSGSQPLLAAPTALVMIHTNHTISKDPQGIPHRLPCCTVHTSQVPCAGHVSALLDTCNKGYIGSDLSTGHSMSAGNAAHICGGQASSRHHCSHCQRLNVWQHAAPSCTLCMPSGQCVLGCCTQSPLKHPLPCLVSSETGPLDTG
jgi:hypothetical protein